MIARATSCTSKKTAPDEEQRSDELGDDVVARLNPTTGEVENLEIMLFSTRRDLFGIPAMAELRLVPGV